MRSIATFSVVAFMTSKQRGWVNPRVKVECDAVSAQSYPAQLAVSKTELTVPTIVSAADPRPAFIWSSLINFGPKTGDVFFGKRREWSRISVSHSISFADHWLEPLGC
jgi:hypothetical protein